jgi:hypothetical protein
MPYLLREIGCYLFIYLYFFNEAVSNSECMAYGRVARTFVSAHVQMFLEFRSNSLTYLWEF